MLLHWRYAQGSTVFILNEVLLCLPTDFLLSTGPVSGYCSVVELSCAPGGQTLIL